jgi:DNA-binding MarR family transcriptional regulator
MSDGSYLEDEDERIHRDQQLSAMEYFILALIDKAELTSLYDFQQQVGLQPGGIRATLLRLERLGLLKRAEKAARQRRALTLTTRGTEILDSTWMACLRTYPESDSILRAACVGLLMGDAKSTAEYLINMSTSRTMAAKEKTMEAEQLGKTRKDPLSIYARMRALTEAQRRSAEAVAFSRLSQSLQEKHQPDEVQPR